MHGEVSRNFIFLPNESKGLEKGLIKLSLLLTLKLGRLRRPLENVCLFEARGEDHFATNVGMLKEIYPLIA
jgi:hypothetical protein